MAAAQHGRVARWQLIDIGLSSDVIAARVQSGLLIPIFAGVYAVGHRDHGSLGAWQAAVLLGGPGSALSHRSSAALRRLLPGPASYSEVTAATSRSRNSKVRWHRGSLPDDEVEIVEGIRVTTLHRTLIDLAAIVGDDQLDQALEVVRQNELTDPVPLGVMLERHRGRRGIARLRRALDRRLDGGRRVGELEHRFRRFLARERLPLPETNVRIEIPGEFITPDCVWREQRLIVELDSRQHHLDPTAFEADRERDAALVVAGWRVIRVTWKRLHSDPSGLATQLRTALDR